MQTTYLKLTKVEEETDLGTSHILGCPDVPSIWNDEGIFYNDEVFIAQINLQDIHNDNLPNNGILYFFYACDSRPYRGIVRYTNDLSSLERIMFNEDAPINKNIDQEYLITQTNEYQNISLFDQNIKLKNYKLQKDEIILFRFNPKNYPNIDLFSEIDEEVCYIIKKNDLDAKAFDKAYLAFKLDN